MPSFPGRWSWNRGLKRNAPTSSTRHTASGLACPRRTSISACCALHGKRSNPSTPLPPAEMQGASLPMPGSRSACPRRLRRCFRFAPTIPRSISIRSDTPSWQESASGELTGDTPSNDSRLQANPRRPPYRFPESLYRDFGCMGLFSEFQIRAYRTRSSPKRRKLSQIRNMLGRSLPLRDHRKAGGKSAGKR